MVGRYTTYPEYKESGIDWLDQIPKTWTVIPVGRVYRRNKRTNHIDKELLSVYRDYGVIPKSSRDDNNNKPSEDLTPYQLVEYNDLVMNKMKAWQGSIAISKFEGIVSPAYFVYQPLPRLFELAISKYVHFLLRSPVYIAQYLRRSKGIRINQWDLDPNEFQRIELLLPNKEEQQKIANFLDHETAKIDTLIEKQKQLIKLLKEKRQAVISHAVTKGLNPNAPMRDSGVEWLGEVPEHWTLPRISHIGRVLNGSTPDKTNLSYWTNGTIPWLASSCLNSAMVVEATLLISEEAFTNSSVELIPSSSLLVGMVGQGKTRGSSAILSLDSCINQNMAAIIPQKNIKVFYLYYLFQSMYEDLRELGRGGNQAALNCEIIRSIKIPLPPIEEQSDIINSLVRVLEILKKTNLYALKQIDLLQERRTALISAAVTGKIDLRNWQAPTTTIPKRNKLYE